MSTPTAPPSALDAQKAEKLALVEKELQDLLARKKVLDRQLATLETNIYTYEGSYLDDPNGNIVKGYDGYVHAQRVEPKQRKNKIPESDRIFSTSSVTYQKVSESLEAKSRENF
ncbi:NuA4-domain-containing protein [Rhizoclosmatium globosum]|uniref:Chromatin modification-related protein EAF6 n=1 Tax=Rhizoclosmatium globosum TaxID=329046 RepID=A0A1Y2CHN8_9FUNG|nr:NuA4-domain-containing protein [Rhizoclosmatium globosum]|eukprot:ORY46522.1 NuA4-domain-containing protein [Rhizoclosmatium globosum]